MNTLDAQRVLETALICAVQPMTVKDMGVLFAHEVGADTIKTLLAHLQEAWSDKGVELVEVASGWRFQSRSDMRMYLDRLHPEKPPKYSRAVLETLAIIAHRQPVTRADMEDIRGVTINSLVIKQLEDRGWVEVIGHKETVGRPALFATTKHFLDDLGLSSIEALKSDELTAQAQAALAQFDAMVGLEGEALETQEGEVHEAHEAHEAQTNMDARPSSHLPPELSESSVHEEAQSPEPRSQDPD